MSFIRAEYVGLLSQLGDAPPSPLSPRTCPHWVGVWVALCPHHLPHQPYLKLGAAMQQQHQQHQQHCSNTCNTTATPETLQQHLQHYSNTSNTAATPATCTAGREGGLMKGQVISSCSSGHIAGDGGDQIDSPLQKKKEFSFSSCCMLSLSL